MTRYSQYRAAAGTVKERAGKGWGLKINSRPALRIWHLPKFLRECRTQDMLFGTAPRAARSEFAVNHYSRYAANAVVLRRRLEALDLALNVADLRLSPLVDFCCRLSGRHSQRQ